MVAAASLVLGACRVDATVAVRVRDDGSGTVRATVRLDGEAVHAALVGDGTLEQRFRIDDLRAAGWKTHWRVAKSQLHAFAVLSLEKPFATAGEVRGIVAELSGEHGPLQAVSVHRDVGPLRTTHHFRGIADLARIDAGIAADPELAASLTGQHIDVAGLDAALTTRVKDSLRLTVRARLPGSGSRTWVVKPGTRAVLRTSSSTFDRGHVAWLVVGAGLGIAALVLLVVGERRARRRRREPRAGNEIEVELG